MWFVIDGETTGDEDTIPTMCVRRAFRFHEIRQQTTSDCRFVRSRRRIRELGAVELITCRCARWPRIQSAAGVYC